MKKAAVLVAFGIVVLLIGFSTNGPARAVVAIGNGYAAPCPTQGANITISGSYMPNCSFAATTPGPSATPSPTATGCGTYSGSWPYTNDTTRCVTLYATPPPSTQAGNIAIGGILQIANSTTPLPSPVVSGSPVTAFYQDTGAFSFENYGDPGSGNANNGFIFWRNNQGTMNRLFTIGDAAGGNFLLEAGQAVAAKALATPPAPTATCTPGGANGSQAYFVQINYVGSGAARKSQSSPESTLTCAPSTLLVVAAPSPVSGSLTWTVSASTTTNTEKEQTQGTSPASGVRIPLTTLSWTSTATLAGATAAAATDASLTAWTFTDFSGATLAALNPHGTGNNAGPWEASTTANGTLGFTPVVYTKAGAATAATYHVAQFTCTFSAATTCLLGAAYWTNGAVFSSSTSIDGCSISHASDTTVSFTFHQTATDTGTVDATASNSETVKGICWGT